MNTNDRSKSSNKQLIASTNEAPSKQVTLEELESLCYTFDSRPRGCGASFASIGDNDDVLF